MTFLFTFSTLIFAFSFTQYAIHNTKYEVRKITYEIINLFLQNEPKFRKNQMNVTDLLTRNYDQMDTWSIGKNEPKTNPNEPKFKKAKMNVNKVSTKEYEKKLNWALYENEPNSNPISAKKMPKQIQYKTITNPTCSELSCPACPERSRRVDSVSKAKNMSGRPKYLTFNNINVNLKARLAFSMLKERTLFRR